MEVRPGRKENKVALQQAEMCDVKLKDRIQSRVERKMD